MIIDTLIREAGLSVSAEPAEDNPDIHPEEVPEECEHYHCALRGWTKQIEFHYTTILGDGPPDTGSALRYLGAVAVEYESCDDLQEWAEEYGFDPENMHTREAFDAVRRLSSELWQMIGTDRYEALRKDVEIEQAIDMAWAGYVRSQIS